MRSKAKTAGPKATPTTENGTVPPRRQRNGERRPREDLTAAEVARLMAAVRATAVVATATATPP